MIIDFRVRVPYKIYEGSNLFSMVDFTEQRHCMPRTGKPVAPSMKAFSLEMLMQEKREAKVDKIVVPVRKALGGQNADLVDLIEQYPDEIIGLAGIDLVQVDYSLREIEKYVVNGSCKGIVMEPGQDLEPWMANDQKAYPIYKYCEKNNIPIAMTFGGISVPSLRYYNPELIDDIAADFPELKLILVHGGWPYVTEVCQICLNRTNVYLAPDFYFIKSPGCKDYVEAANALLSDKIIFSSAYPVLPLGDAVECYRNSGLSEQALEKVLYKNAATVLGL